jgi:integrase
MSDIRKRVGKKGTTYQVRYPDAAAKSGHSYKTFRTYKEAIAFREDASARVGTVSADPDVRTVPQGIQKWLDICEKEGRDGRDPVTHYTLKNYRYRADIVTNYPWTKDLTELTKPDIIEFRSWLLQNHSRDVTHKVLSSFHSMVLELMSRGVISKDFASGVTVSSSSRYDEPISIPTEKEIHAMLGAADKLANSRNAQVQRTWEKYRPMLYLAVDSGMRPQEHIVVARSAITDRGVQIDRALDGGGTEITVTKTRAGRRFIDLNDTTLDMLNHYARNHTISNRHDLVFPTSNGRWQTVRNWRRRAFNRACEEAGLVEVVKRQGKNIERPMYRPYDLRHFYASMLIDQKVNLKRIQTLMGHRNIQTTLNTYGHLIERAESAKEERNSVLSFIGEKSCGKSVASPL